MTNILFAPKKDVENITYEESLRSLSEMSPESSWAETAASAIETSYTTSPITGLGRKLMDTGTPLSPEELRRQYPNMPEDFYGKGYTKNEASSENWSIQANKEYEARLNSRNTGTLGQIGYGLVGSIGDPLTAVGIVGSVGVGAVAARMAPVLASMSYSSKVAQTGLNAARVTNELLAGGKSLSVGKMIAGEFIQNAGVEIGGNLAASSLLGNQRYGAREYTPEEMFSNIAVGTAFGMGIHSIVHNLSPRDRETISNIPNTQKQNLMGDLAELKQEVARLQAGETTSGQIEFNGKSLMDEYRRKVYNVSDAEFPSEVMHLAGNDSLFAIKIDNEHYSLEPSLGDTVVAFDNPSIQENIIRKNGAESTLFAFNKADIKVMDLESEFLSLNKESWLKGYGDTYKSVMDLLDGLDETKFKEFAEQLEQKARAEGYHGFSYKTSNGEVAYQIFKDAITDEDSLTRPVATFEATGRKPLETYGEMKRRQLTEEGHLTNGKKIKINENGYVETDIMYDGEDSLKQGYVEYFDTNHIEFIKDNIIDDNIDNLKLVYEDTISGEMIQYFKDLEAYHSLDETISNIEEDSVIVKELKDQVKKEIDYKKNVEKLIEHKSKAVTDAVENMATRLDDPQAIKELKKQMLKEFNDYVSAMKKNNPDMARQIHKAAVFCLRDK